MQKHSETALDTPKIGGYREQFSDKNALDTRQTSGNLQNFRGANVLQKGKRKMQVLKVKHLHFVGYPVDYLFSNQFMEELGRIYQLKKYFPSFDD